MRRFAELIYALKYVAVCRLYYVRHATVRTNARSSMQIVRYLKHTSVHTSVRMSVCISVENEICYLLYEAIFF